MWLNYGAWPHLSFFFFVLRQPVNSSVWSALFYFTVDCSLFYNICMKLIDQLEDKTPFKHFFLLIFVIDKYKQTWWALFDFANKITSNHWQSNPGLHVKDCSLKIWDTCSKLYDAFWLSKKYYRWREFGADSTSLIYTTWESWHLV